MGKITHWYKFPDSVITAAKKAGLQSIPTEIGLVDLTGDDHEKAMDRAMAAVSASGGAAAAAQFGTKFRRRLIIQAIVGVNFNPSFDVTSRQKVSEASPDPNLQPENVFLALHSKALALVEQAFTRINDGAVKESEDFFKSETQVAE